MGFVIIIQKSGGRGVMTYRVSITFDLKSCRDCPYYESHDFGEICTLIKKNLYLYGYGEAFDIDTDNEIADECPFIKFNDENIKDKNFVQIIYVHDEKKG